MTQREFCYHRNLRIGSNSGFLLAFAFCIFSLFGGSPISAQVQTGISGTVADTTGAVIQHATVSATNTSTGIVTNAITSSVGTFTILGVLPGTYTVDINAAGFQSVQMTVVVDVAKMSTVNFDLSPGAATQTVQITGSSISLDTSSPAVGTTLEPQLVQAAPLEISGLARQINSFIYFTPGVQGNSTVNMPGAGGVKGSGPNINGGVALESEVDFNGVPVNFVQNQGVQTYINPPYEAVNEFRLNSFTFEPQFGPGQGAVTFNMASGTNQLHGDAFEILRNQLFDSDGFFPARFDANKKPLPPINQQNNWGFTVGGPIAIPRLYQGKNRTFFHFSSDWFRQNLAQTAIGTVPTAAMKQGDFSNFVDTNGNLIPIYDPVTGQPFSGNKILPTRFSAAAKAILPLIPDPDRPGLVSGLQSNKSPAVASTPVTQLLWAYTVDHNLTSSQSIHFSEWRDSVTSPNFQSAPIVPASNELQSEINTINLGSGFLLNYVKTFTPNLVMTGGANAVGLVTGQHNTNSVATFTGVSGSTVFPYIQFDGQNATTNWGAYGHNTSTAASITSANNRTLGIVIVNNWLWNRGRHTLNFGGQFRRALQDVTTCNACGGGFTFSQRTTSTPNSSDPNFGKYGSSFASFLLGQADSAAIISATEMRLRNKAFAFYADDVVKVNSRFTADLGVRYDILVPFTEDNNNFYFVDRNAPDPGAGNIPGAVTKFGNCPGCAGITRAPIRWKYFQPRLGFSYQLTHKTVLQTGFYISVLNGGAYEFGSSQVANFMEPLLAGSFFRNTTGGSTPGYGSWDTQALPVPQATPFNPSMGNDGIVIDFPYKSRNTPPALPNAPPVSTAPYVQSWNFRVQRELPWNMMLSAAYIGNRTIHLPTTLELSDQLNPSVLKYGNLLPQNILAPAVVAAGFTPPYPQFVQQFGASATLAQSLRTFPQFFKFHPRFEMDGTAFYNAVQVQAEKRFEGGLSYLANIAIAKDDSNTAIGSSQFTQRGEWFQPKRGVWTLQFDQKYVFNMVATYALPFGRGKRFLNSSNALVSELAGGWQFSGILSYAGGYPFGVYNSSQNPLLSNGTNRADVVPGVGLQTFDYNKSIDYFTGKTAVRPAQFTTNAFVSAGTWEVGNSKRTYSELRTPPYRMENFSGFKTFPIGERVRATLRVDYFNAFNRTQLQPPGALINQSTFGQITSVGSQISNRQGQATFRVEF